MCRDYVESVGVDPSQFILDSGLALLSWNNRQDGCLRVRLDHKNFGNHALTKRTVSYLNPDR